MGRHGFYRYTYMKRINNIINKEFKNLGVDAWHKFCEMGGNLIKRIKREIKRDRKEMKWKKWKYWNYWERGKWMISNRGLIIFALIFAHVQTAMLCVVWSSLIIYLNYKFFIVHSVCKSGTWSHSIQCANDYTSRKWSGNVNTSTYWSPNESYK